MAKLEQEQGSRIQQCQKNMDIKIESSFTATTPFPYALTEVNNLQYHQYLQGDQH